MPGPISNDPTRLQAIRAACPSDPSFVELAIDTFVGTSRELLVKIRTAIAAQDPKAAADAAHPLYSSSAQLGMCRLSALAKDLETLGRGGCLEGGPDLLIRLESEYQMGIEFLAAHRRGGADGS